ncbi:MAG: hypothetical protein R3Y63_04805 [Eubacteriales bacterium]
MYKGNLGESIRDIQLDLLKTCNKTVDVISAMEKTPPLEQHQTTIASDLMQNESKNSTNKNNSTKEESYDNSDNPNNSTQINNNCFVLNQTGEKNYVINNVGVLNL